MTAKPGPPRPRPLSGRGPSLATIHEVESILRSATSAISLNEIKRRMHARAVRHASVRQVVDELKRLGFVVEGSKGVLWVVNPAPALWDAAQWTRL